MGLIDRLLKSTPLYNSYQNFKKQRTDKEQKKLEEKLHPLRVIFYKQFLSPGDLVFDVGANVGNRVAAFLECQTNVVAVEPQPNCASILKERFNTKIIIENFGLGEKDSELEMQIATDSTVSSFSQEYISNTKNRFKYSDWVDKIIVNITTLDKLIEKHGSPKFCKIDVEGFELEVLKGLHQPIPFLSLEYCVPEMHSQLLDCIHYLNSISPNGEFNYSIGESMQWALPSWKNFDAFLDHVESTSFVQTSFGDIYFKA